MRIKKTVIPHTVYTEYLDDRYKQQDYHYIEGIFGSSPFDLVDLIFKNYVDKMFSKHTKQINVGEGRIGFEKQIIDLPYLSVVRAGISNGLWYEERVGIIQVKAHRTKFRIRPNTETSSWLEYEAFIRVIPKTIKYALRYWTEYQRDIDDLLLQLYSKFGHGMGGYDLVANPYIETWDYLKKDWGMVPLYIRWTNYKDATTYFPYEDGERYKLILPLDFEVDYYLIELQKYNEYKLLYQLAVDKYPENQVEVVPLPLEEETSDEEETV